MSGVDPDRGEWYAARRGRTKDSVRRLLKQPTGGFDSVGDVMNWLEEQGHIEYVDEEGGWYRGWGDPFCAVLGSRGDPWEEPPQLSVLEGGQDG